MYMYIHFPLIVFEVNVMYNLVLHSQAMAEHNIVAEFYHDCVCDSMYMYVCGYSCVHVEIVI